MIREAINEAKLDRNGNKIDLSDEHFLDDVREFLKEFHFEYVKRETWGDYIYSNNSRENGTVYIYVYSNVFKSRNINLSYLNDKIRTNMVKNLKPIMKYYNGYEDFDGVGKMIRFKLGK